MFDSCLFNHWELGNSVMMTPKFCFSLSLKLHAYALPNLNLLIRSALRENDLVALNCDSKIKVLLLHRGFRTSFIEF